MAHPEQRLFLAQCRRHFVSWFQDKTVLEVGSLNVNGTARDFFTGCRYLGIDVGPGPGVDLVASGDSFAGNAASFDVVISCESFEHDPHWQATFVNCVRMMKADGIFILTCASFGRKQHGTCSSRPEDSPHIISAGAAYYRNLGEEDFRSLGRLNEWFGWHRFFVDHVAKDLYFLGLGPRLAACHETADGFADEVRQTLYRKNVLGEW